MSPSPQPINVGWSSCSTCIGSTYVDQQGNATGDGTAVVNTPGLPVGSYNGTTCAINGWLIAAALGVFLLVAGAHKK